MTIKSINHVGEKFNRLTIIRQYIEPPFTRQRVDCVCERGKKTSTSLSKVLLGMTKSCGCIRDSIKVKKRTPYGESSFKRIYSTYERNARVKNIAFHLSKDELRAIITQNCFYCNIIPQQIQCHPRSNGEFIYNGIDRLDNNKGYILENVVPCCRRCNFMKNKFHIKEFIEIIRKIYKNTQNIDIN